LLFFVSSRESAGQWTDPVNGQTRSSVAVASLMLSRLDYGNATLAGIPSYLLQQLQSVMNAATQLIDSTSKYEHVTLLLNQLHWLKDPQLKTHLFSLSFPTLL